MANYFESKLLNLKSNENSEINSFLKLVDGKISLILMNESTLAIVLKWPTDSAFKEKNYLVYKF